MKFKSCNLHSSWNGDLNFNINDVKFSLYSFNLFQVTSSSNDAISTGDLNFNINDVKFSLYSFNLFQVTSSSNDAISTPFIAISNSYDEILTWIV